MGIIRSEYTIEQFEEAFQKLAHSIPKFQKVRCDDFTIIFHYDGKGKPRRITVTIHKRTGRKNKWGDEEIEWWSFAVEKKEYMDSPHSTKIDYGPYDEVKGKVEEFIEKLMEGVKPKSRFSLKQFARSG